MMTANKIGSVAAFALTAGGVFLSPATPFQGCPAGTVQNPFSTQCVSPVDTPVINGVPCVPSNLGLCNSFVQNQQPIRMPVTSIG